MLPIYRQERVLANLNMLASLHNIWARLFGHAQEGRAPRRAVFSVAIVHRLGGKQRNSPL